MTTTFPVPSVFDAALPTVDYGDGLDREEAHRVIREARRHAPIAIGPYGPELLSHELVRSMLRDSRFVVPKGISLVVQGIDSGPVWDRVTRLLVSLGGAEHQRLRRLVARAFTPRAAERMRTVCADVVNELVDPVAHLGACDVTTAIADHYPVQIMCALLGAPRDDWPLFSGWAVNVSKSFGLGVAEEQASILEAWDAFDAYLEELIVERRSALADDLLSDLIRAEANGERLTHDELRNLALMLLNAGTDTTRNQLSAAVEVFADHPEQWALLAERPELANGAVEEVMRHSPIIFNGLRKAIEDVELGGVLIPAGTFVIANTAAANRDPAVYADPEQFDISRVGAPAMLTFGGGVHYCLGVHLARVELAEALSVLARRMPNLRCTGPAPWKPITQISGPTTLPVSFDSGY
jgi:cytochrome P450